MPIFLAILLLTILEVERGEKRSSHGHERSHGPEQKKDCHI